MYVMSWSIGFSHLFIPFTYMKITIYILNFNFSVELDNVFYFIFISEMSVKISWIIWVYIKLFVLRILILIRETILISRIFPIKVQKQIDIQTPICVLIRKAEKKTCTLSEITSEWLTLKSKLPTSCFKVVLKSKTPSKHLKTILECLEDRTEMALTPLALTAFYIDPNSTKILLTSAQKIVINRFFMKYLQDQELNDLIEFAEKSGKFVEYFEKSLSPTVFWKLVTPLSPILADLALKLVSIPASNSQIERIFHNWATIRTKLRNRLTSERSKKLLHTLRAKINRPP